MQHSGAGSTEQIIPEPSKKSASVYSSASAHSYTCLMCYIAYTVCQGWGQVQVGLLVFVLKYTFIST